MTGPLPKYKQPDGTVKITMTMPHGRGASGRIKIDGHMLSLANIQHGELAQITVRRSPVNGQ